MPSNPFVNFQSPPPASGDGGIIHLDNIQKSYFMGRNELQVLKGISLDIFKNEYVALMGPSGSGKRTLINDAGITLDDEPTGNLDSKTSEEISDIFRKIRSEGNTVVLVTHEEDIAKHAHRVVRLRDGMIESDAPKKLMSAPVENNY